MSSRELAEGEIRVRLEEVKLLREVVQKFLDQRAEDLEDVGRLRGAAEATASKTKATATKGPAVQGTCANAGTGGTLVHVDKYPNQYAFRTPLTKDSGLWRFLQGKILDPHRQKDALDYIFVESAGLIKEIRWSKCSEAHNKEIMNAAEWCLKRAEEKKK